MDFDPVTGSGNNHRLGNEFNDFTAPFRKLYLHGDQCLRMYFSGISQCGDQYSGIYAFCTNCWSHYPTDLCGFNRKCGFFGIAFYRNMDIYKITGCGNNYRLGNQFNDFIAPFRKLYLHRD